MFIYLRLFILSLNKIYTMLKLLTLLLSIAFLPAFAQTGTIKGTVTTSDGKPAKFVNIVLSGTNKNGVVDENGRYTINKVAAGTYTLTASFTGLATQKSIITVIAGETNVVNFTLTEDNRQLQEVVVNSNSRLASKETDYVARMPLKNLENPQVYNVVGKALIKEQIMTDIKEVFRAAPGVAPTEYVTGSFAVLFRGFTNFDYARNGMSTSVYRSGTEIANLERIELIKGPSGTLFGSQVSTFGGAINLVTKKPYSGFGGEVDYSMGSFDLSRASIDLNTPLNKEKTVLLRFNAVKHQQNSSNEYGKNKRYMFTPSISYQASDRLSFLFDFEYFNSTANRLAYTLLFGDEVPFKSTKDIPLGFKKSFFQNDLLSDAEATKYFGQAKYQISKNWVSTTGVSHVNEFLNHSYQPYVEWINASTASTKIIHFGPRERTYGNIQQNFNGTFNTGKIQHNLLIGVSYEFNNETLTDKEIPLDQIDINKPFQKTGLSRVTGLLADNSIPTSNDAYGGNAFGLYASDVIKWTDRLSTMVSLRFDRFKQTYDGGFVQPSLSPKLGIVYQVVKDQVSLFGNFMNGFQNQGPVEQPDGSFFKPKPVFANQMEGGIKADLPGGKLGGSISYYYIKIDNALRIDNAQFSFQDGKQVSKGVEIELTANPFTGLNIVAGYGFNENKFVKADVYEGKLATQAPKSIVNYWLNYQLPFQNIKGIALGFGGNYVGDSYFNASNTYTIPAYHVINAAFSYQREKWKFGFKLNNISNVEYWDLVGNPQFTRNFVANFSFKF